MIQGRSFLILVSIALSLPFSFEAYAGFEFNPIIATFTPTGPGSTVSFQAVNPDDIKVPVQISVVAREPNLLGEEVYKETDEVDEQFKIFPSQFILNAKETRTVRVTWVGAPKVPSELAFRILAEEVPVDLEDPNKRLKKPVARFNITSKYVGSLYVVTSGAAPKLTIEAKPTEKSNPPRMTVILKNTGTLHQVLKAPTIKFEPATGGPAVEPSPDGIKAIAGQNILANKTRQFDIQWPKGLPVGPVKVSLDLPKD